MLSAAVTCNAGEDGTGVRSAARHERETGIKIVAAACEWSPAGRTVQARQGAGSYIAGIGFNKSFHFACCLIK